MLTELIFYSLIGGLFSLVGGLFLVFQKDLSKKIMVPLLAFAAGAFLSAALLDILPEAIEMVEESHPIFLFALIGFTSFFILERWLMKSFFHHHKSDEHSDHTESLPLLLILGDSFHNFLDGIVIAFAFLADPALGLVSALAIAAHEIPQEIGDFSILLNQGWDRSRIIAINIFQSLLTIPGVLLGYYAGSIFSSQLPYLLALAAGIFIYIGASDLIPEIHHKSGHKHFWPVVLPLILGIFLVWYLVGLAHH
jgi:zinc and cadmium transporter